MTKIVSHTVKMLNNFNEEILTSTIKENEEIWTNTNIIHQPHCRNINAENCRQITLFKLNPLLYDHIIPLPKASASGPAQINERATLWWHYCDSTTSRVKITFRQIPSKFRTLLSTVQWRMCNFCVTVSSYDHTCEVYNTVISINLPLHDNESLKKQQYK